MQSGLIPNSSAFSLLITTTAAPASLIPEELPAVTTPPSLNAGRSLLMLSAFLKAPFNLATFSIVVPNLGNSSVSKMIGSPFLCGISTGTISSLNLPALIASSALFWEITENSSNSSLVIPHCSATFSAVIPMWYPLNASQRPSLTIMSTI